MSTKVSFKKFNVVFFTWSISSVKSGTDGRVETIHSASNDGRKDPLEVAAPPAFDKCSAGARASSYSQEVVAILNASNVLFDTTDTSFLIFNSGIDLTGEIGEGYD